MRIISQNGEIDVPYETSILHIVTSTKAEYSKSFIFYTPNNSMDSNELALYSTEKKAQKAMEMLRCQYARLQVVKILASGTCEHMGKSLSKDEFLECNLMYREMNIFQFPKDEDVEV